MTALLDPWKDARQLAERLRMPGTRLVLVLGAEAWCGKCQTFRPHFDARAAKAEQNEVWLWLDLEDHAEFVGDYLPEDLPQLIVYDDTAMVACQALEPTAEALEEALRMSMYARPSAASDTGIRANLLKEDWVV